MENYIVAIVVPVYNVEKYIKECLISIKEQTYKNFITIIVNDGTKDNSVSIIEDTIKDDERFVLLNKENGGLSSARNYALNYIKDNSISLDYIVFLDSDDAMEKDFVEVFVNKMSKNNADIAVSFYKELYKSQTKILSNDLKDSLDFDKEKHMLVYCHYEDYPEPYTSANIPFLGNKMFYYPKVKHIHFNEKKGIIGEDFNYMLDAFISIKKITLIPKNLLIYRKRASSLSHSKNSNRFKQNFDMFISIYNKYSDFIIDNCIKREILENFFKTFIHFISCNQIDEAKSFWQNNVKLLQTMEHHSKISKNDRKRILFTRLGFTFNYLYYKRKIKQDTINDIDYSDYFD